MKIYEIGTGYTPIPATVAAATESVVEELTKAYMEMKQPVEIIDISAQERKPNNLPITQVNVPSFFTGSDVSLGLVHKLKRVVYSVLLAFKLKRILKNENENAVFHFHNQYNLFFFTKLVSRKLRSKVVIAYTNHNGMWSLPWEKVSSTLNKRYFQEIISMKSADLIFVLNQSTKDNIVNNLEVDSEKITVIKNGVNTDVYYPVDNIARRELLRKFNLEGKKVILQVGSVYENKGQARVIEKLAESLKKNPNLVYAYVGGIISQEYFEVINRTARSLEIADRVIYLGTASPGEEMNSLYNLAAATVFASEYEGFPLVCIESISAGVPVILCSELAIEIGDGVVCIKDNIEHIVDECVISDSLAAENLRVSARENAENNYSWSRIAKDYLTVFKKTKGE